MVRLLTRFPGLSTWVLALTAILLPASPVAQLVINEYSASNKSMLTDAYGDYPDWIEIYNSGATPVSLAGHFLSDSPGNLQKWAFPAQNLGANQRMLIFASNRDLFDGAHYHTSFKLTQMKGEKILLSNSLGTILDSLTMVPTQRNHARGRSTDGAGSWAVFSAPTADAPNAGAYQAYAAKPLFSVAPGFYPSGQIIMLSSPDPNVTIRYTLNGDQPSQASTAYTGAFPVFSTAVIRAASFSGNPAILPSFAETNTYFINANHPNLAVISVASPNYDDLFNSNMGEIMTAFEYFDTLGQFQFEMDGDIRGHGNDSWAYPQKGMRFYARDDYGYANNIEYRLFQASPRDEFDVILLKAGASDNFPGGAQNGLYTCHLRDVFAQTLSQKHDLNLDERSWEPCVIYINGQYWGIYEIRERIDADYADYYFDQDPDSVDMLEYWGGLTINEGSDTAWNNLYNFMMGNNLAIPANHAYVDARLDLMSVIDYFILNTYLVNTDWLNWNTSWWCGRSTPGVKWRYNLWDMDNIYNLGQNYTGVGTTTYLNDPCNPTTLFPNDPDVPHTGMFNALMADSAFEELYINRYADLLNTALNCDTLLNHLQWIVDRLAPEMPQQAARWGGQVSVWMANLDSMRVQIMGRCQVVDSLMVGCYNLSGPYSITILVDPPGAGDVRVNTITPTGYPYVANYYGGVAVNLAADTSQGNPFLNWTVLHHNLLPSLVADSVHLSLSSTDTIIAHFDTITVGNSGPVRNGGQHFIAYPTLVRQNLRIDFQLPDGDLNPEFHVMDLLGHVVADISASVAGKAAGREELNFTELHLAHGMYLLRMSTGNWQETKRVVWIGE